MISPSSILTPDTSELAQVCANLLASAPTHGTIDVAGWNLAYIGPRALARTLDLLIKRRIYDLPYLADNALIIDGGAYLGVSALRWLSQYPTARVLAFEPDPVLFPLLVRNLAHNRAANVSAINLALAGQSVEATFYSTASDAGSLSGSSRGEQVTVATTRLSDYIAGPVGLLKLNIEGAEWEVLDELGDRLGLVDQLLIEYHGFWQLPQTLHLILGQLHAQGFSYIISHFNDENRACVPPLRLEPEYRYFLLIYARKMG